MRSQTGAPATGESFFDREKELRLLEAKVRGGTHILLAGQRRMGKTSLAKALGDRLRGDGWEFLFVDVEDAASPQDFVRDIAKAAHGVAGTRGLTALGRWVKDNIEELSAQEFSVKLRAAGDYAWRQQGESLVKAFAGHDTGVLLVLDELPIFLARLLAQEEGQQQARLFLRWLRGLRQQHAGSSFRLLVSGSVGMAPMVARMGMPDSINDLYEFRWARGIAIQASNVCVALQATVRSRSTTPCSVPSTMRSALASRISCSPSSPVSRTSP